MGLRPGRLLIDLASTQLSNEERERLAHPGCGGVVLFSRNFEHPSQLMSLVKSIRSIRSALLICVDQEGGRVQRFKTGFTSIPPMGAFAPIYDADPFNAAKQVKACGKLIAKELQGCGIDMSFAPVLDVRLKNESVIGDRSFHQDPEVVTLLARHFISGLSQQGMAACGKHFPGHGGVLEDSHVALPVDNRSFEEIDRCDLIPFKALLHECKALMTAHVLYSDVDEHIATFSSYWLKSVLRDRLHYQGIIFSDDLAMEAVKSIGSVSDRVRLAIEAGCDMVMLCNAPEQLDEALEESASIVFSHDVMEVFTDRFLALCN